MDKLLGLYQLELMSPLMIGSYTHLTMNNYKEKNKNMRIDIVDSYRKYLYFCMYTVIPWLTSDPANEFFG